jgi:cell wall assembly regulator SMI1
MTGTAQISAMASYFDWLRRYAPEVAGQLRPPAGEADLDALEARLGQRMPEDVRALYLLHAGQTSQLCLGVVYGLEFHTLSEVASEWNEWRELREAAGYDPTDHDASEGVFEPGVVHTAYTTPGWIPLFRVPGRADFLGVDLNPLPGGTYGQVINFGRDEPRKYAAFPRLEDLFAMLLAWGQAEITDPAGGDPAEVTGHLEDLFGHGGLVFERLHARASGEEMELLPFGADDDEENDADEENDEGEEDGSEYQPPEQLREEYGALVDACHAYLNRIGRITRTARCLVSRVGTGTRGGFEIWQVDDWSWAGIHEISKCVEVLLSRAESLGLPTRVEIWFERTGGTWTHSVSDPEA